MHLLQSKQNHFKIWWWHSTVHIWWHFLNFSLHLHFINQDANFLFEINQSSLVCCQMNRQSFFLFSHKSLIWDGNSVYSRELLWFVDYFFRLICGSFSKSDSVPLADLCEYINIYMIIYYLKNEWRKIWCYFVGDGPTTWRRCARSKTMPFKNVILFYYG